jgi:hypothetical protein
MDSEAPPAPKKGLGLLVAGPMPDPKGEKVPEEGLESEAEDMAAQGVMDAFAANDPAAFKDSLKTFLEAAGYSK